METFTITYNRVYIHTSQISEIYVKGINIFFTANANLFHLNPNPNAKSMLSGVVLYEFPRRRAILRRIQKIKPSRMSMSVTGDISPHKPMNKTTYTN